MSDAMKSAVEGHNEAKALLHIWSEQQKELSFLVANKDQKQEVGIVNSAASALEDPLNAIDEIIAAAQDPAVLVRKIGAKI